MRFRIQNPIERFFSRVWNPVEQLPSLEDHLLDTTGLDSRSPGDLDTFIRSLGEQLSIEIEVITNAPTADTDLETEFGVSMTVAEMLYDPASEKAVIFVPTHIREDHFLFFKFVLHEVSHLVSGHPIPVLDSARDVWWPPKRLARSTPGRDLHHNEREADLRAEWSLMVALTGRETQDAENHETTF